MWLEVEDKDSSDTLDALVVNMGRHDERSRR
jgi:hypothetical protein